MGSFFTSWITESFRPYDPKSGPKTAQVRQLEEEREKVLDAVFLLWTWNILSLLILIGLNRVAHLSVAWTNGASLSCMAVSVVLTGSVFRIKPSLLLHDDELRVLLTPLLVCHCIAWLCTW